MVLSCTALAAIIFARPLPAEPSEKTEKASQVLAVASQAMPPQTSVSPSPESQATQPTQQNESFSNIRIVDSPSGENRSCEENAWPYIDPRCLAAAKDESDGTKIGPRPIDARSQSNAPANAQKPDLQVGSMTAAIIPARPKVVAPVRPEDDATNGIAPSEEYGERIIELSEAAPMSAIPVSIKRTSVTSRNYAEIEQPAEVQGDRLQRTSSVERKKKHREVTTQQKADQPERRASAHKKNRHVAEARRKKSSPRMASSDAEPQRPPFFLFPFVALLSQER